MKRVALYVSLFSTVVIAPLAIAMKDSDASFAKEKHDYCVEALKEFDYLYDATYSKEWLLVYEHEAREKSRSIYEAEKNKRREHERMRIRFAHGVPFISTSPEGDADADAIMTELNRQMANKGN